ASTSYSYTVLSIDNSANQSAPSAAASATTPVCPDVIAPTIPSGLTPNAVSYDQVNLSWTASTDSGGSGLKGYVIYRNGASLTQVSAPTTSYTDAGLAASTGYSYTVLALDNVGNQSAPSAAASATTPACPDAIAPTIPSG